MKQDDMNDFIDAQHTVVHELARVAHDLGCLGECFVETGNRDVGDRLMGHADHLLKLSALARKSYHQKIHDDLRQSQQATTNMISAVLAVVTKTSG